MYGVYKCVDWIANEVKRESYSVAWLIVWKGWRGKFNLIENEIAGRHDYKDPAKWHSETNSQLVYQRKHDTMTFWEATKCLEIWAASHKSVAVEKKRKKKKSSMSSFSWEWKKNRDGNKTKQNNNPWCFHVLFLWATVDTFPLKFGLEMNAEKATMRKSCEQTGEEQMETKRESGRQFSSPTMFELWIGKLCVYLLEHGKAPNCVKRWGVSDAWEGIRTQKVVNFRLSRHVLHDDMMIEVVLEVQQSRRDGWTGSKKKILADFFAAVFRNH